MTKQPLRPKNNRIHPNRQQLSVGEENDKHFEIDPYFIF